MAEQSAEFTGRAVLITGGAAGIGLATARDHSVRAAVAEARQGMGPLDILVINARHRRSGSRSRTTMTTSGVASAT
jgi:NAD(P)-dependent dehydrogenase (short-subunit alcohol dehydrogenase family)